MRNKFAVAAIIGCMIFGAFALNWSNDTEIVAGAQVGQIDGNAEVPPTPVMSTILALPENYKSDALSQDLLKGFASNATLDALRKSTDFTSYSATHPQFQHNWSSRLPEVAQGKPVVLVMNGDEVAYKSSGKSAKAVAAEVKQLVERMRPCPDCPECRPRPKPEPDPAPVPDAPVIPDSPVIDDTPAVVNDEADPVMLVLTALVGGFVGWAFMFKRKLSS